MRNLFRALICLVGVLMLTEIQAQPWTYDFGTATGSNNSASSGNTTFLNSLTATPSGGGTYRIRTGSVPGTGFVVANPGTSLGTASELQINASTSTSTNKFGIYDWSSASTVGYVKFNVRTTATAGIGTLAFAFGINTLVTDNNGFSNQYGNSVANFNIAYAAGAISTVTRRENVTGNVAITGSGFAKDTDQSVEIYANNAATSTTYYKGGTSYTLNSQRWDLWVAGTKVSPSGGWLKAGALASGTNLSGIGFFAETSTGANNNAFLYIDDIEYSNSLPTCPAPTTQASSVTSANITTSGLDVNWTNGSGAGRVVKMNTSNSFTAPTNGSNPTANTTWQNAGEQVIYNGTAGGPVTITNLNQSTTYYFRVYEYCDAERTYNTTTATNNPNNFTTAAGPGLLASSLTAFGAQCTGSDYGPNSFTITGANLTTADVTVGSLTGYTFATSAGGPYNSSLNITQGGGAFTQDIYVLFSPTLVQSYDGNISVGGGGASSINVAASGSGISSAAPSLISPSSSAITSTTATLGANLSSLNCNTVTARGIEWSLTNGFADGTGTTVGETGSFGTGVFTEAVTGLPGNSTIYWKAYATNSQGTTRTAQQSFTTSQEFLSVGDISIIAMNSSTPDNFAFVNWVNINPNMVIKFTDNGFNGVAPNSANTATNARGTENFVIWKNTSNAVIPAGTVIKIEGLTASIGTASAGSGSGLNGLTSGGEQIFAYQGTATSGGTPDFVTAVTNYTYTGNILYGIHLPGSGSTTWLTSGTANSNDSYLPTELNVANGNIVLPAGAVGGQYTGTRSALGSIIAYRNLVNNPANWTTVTSSFVSIDQTAFSINPNPATQIAITSINGGVTPSVNTPFTVTFEVRDALNNAAAVGIDTDFSITLNTGSGALSGTLSGTITAGNGSMTISGVVYNTAESITIDVNAVSGMTLTSDSETFTVADAADHVLFVALDNYVYTSNNIPTFNVQALRPDNSIDPNYNGSATVSMVSGTGTMLGTLTKTVTAGQAFFNDISFDTPGVKQIEVVMGSLPTVTSFNITVSTASLTEVYLPQAIEGATSTNNNRMPYAFRVTLNGLKPNSTFRYYPGAVISSDGATSNGAGNAIFADAGGFVRSTGTSLGSAGNYGEFTTNGSGSYTGWFILEPTGNSRFTSGNDVYLRLMLNNGNGGTATSVRLSTTNTARVYTFGALAANGTALRGNSSAAAKNFVLLYDNETGTGRPIAATYVESDGTANTNANSFPTFYETNVDGIAGAYAVIIPNTLSNGIRRIEQRQLSDGTLSGCAATDADGIWPSGANTVNPTGGITTIRVITSTDAPLIANPEVCGNYIDDNCDGNVDELCPGNFVNDTPGGAANVAFSSNVSYPNCYPINGDNTTANNSAESGVYSGPDSWYKFVAQSSAVSITMNSATMDDAIALYSKSGLTYTLIDSENSSIGAADFERLNVSGLTPGTTYYVSAGAASGVTGGSFTLCIQHLMPSGCSYTTPVGGFLLCNSYKAIYRGSTAQGVTYNFNFTGIGGGASGTSSVNGSNGLIVLSNPSLQLRYGGIYNVQVDVNYALQNSAGGTENIFVAGTLAAGNCASVTMATQPMVEVKSVQECPAVLLRSNYLIGVPVAGNNNACGAINYTYEFTQLDACGGTTSGFPTEYTTTTPTPYLKLANLTSYANTGYWRVRIRPNFLYGNGSYGPPSDISVNNTAASVMIDNNGPSNNNTKSVVESMSTALYPNPNNGELINLNITGLDGDVVGVRVVNALGQVVFSHQYVVDGSMNTIVAFDQPLSDGVYLVEFNVNDESIVERMMVQH